MALAATAALLAAGLGEGRRPAGLPTASLRLVGHIQRHPSRSQLLLIARRYLAHHRCPGIRDPSQLARRMAHDLKLHLTTLAAAAGTACNPTRAAH